MGELRIVSRRAEPRHKPASPDESGVRRLPQAEDDLIDLTDDAVELVARRPAVPPPVPVDMRPIDFDALVKGIKPKTAGYATCDAYPIVPGIPACFHVSSAPPPPETFDRELAMHVAVVWGAAVLGALFALV